MFPEGTPDPEYPDENGVRKKKRNPVQEWQAKHQGAHYVWNRTALLQAASDSSVTHLMGNDSTHNHCPPHDGRHGPPVPSLQVSAGPLSHRPL